MGSHILIVFLWVVPLTMTMTTLKIQNQPLVSRNLYEQEPTEFELECISCTGGAGGPYSISRKSVTPSNDACSNCFQVYDNINGQPLNAFCLYFLPSQGTLNYQRQRRYTVTVECLDSVGDRVEADIDVRIRTNEPPFFNTLGIFSGTCNIEAQTTTAGQVIGPPFNWNPGDPDNDPVTYTMTSDPPSNLFEIESTTGTIRATQELKTFCNPSISFTINARDTDGNAIGPFVATCNVNNPNTPPTISNVNKEISLSEDTLVGSAVVLPYLRTTPLTPIVTYDFDTFPTSARSFINITNTRGLDSLILQRKLDFESPTTQNFNISIRPQNGFCDPIEHFLFIRTTDANDPPVLLPKNVSKTVNEGGVLIDPGWLLTEEDFGDTDIYSIIGGNEEGLWSIDPSTGFITSTGTIDLDPSTREKNWTLLVQVEDRAGSTDNATINIIVEDINDNAPTFTMAVFSVTLMDCDTPRNLGTILMATDVDSDYRNNNVFHFTEVENDFIKIFNDGTALIKAVPPLGTTSTLSTRVTDLGEVPGPLTSTTTGNVIVTTVACTTVIPTTVVVNTVAASTADSNSNSNSNANANANANAVAGLNSLVTVAGSGANSAGTGFGDIFLWALAGLLGLLLLAALAYMIYRFCAKPCTGSSSWSEGCGCNRAATPKHIRPFSQERAYSRQKDEFKPASKEIEEEEEEIIQTAVVPAPVTYGNSIVPQAKVNRYLRVRRLIPLKQNVKIKQVIPIPPNQAVPFRQNPQGPGSLLSTYQNAPTGAVLPTGTNTKPVQGGVN
ncbi:cadherin-13-like isoform X2 [Haliotis cracherodii]|uniref:cadherin-13-like isoform X1 n=1 Tax=Haliotis cracherodii TaxID=6455 RepID=UPI0039EC59FA